ncbi:MULTISPECIES: DNA polymerase III subunit beta [Corynebacterium]|uniref:Beta sliding clamp n=1 Tax=Corynebacterium flavescens TaxID=28028 RepID=A0A1L7CIS1_CORFL|nr:MULTISPECIES: DNA polymerase III subunit beta [Corynebacterium]APT85756.1 DNA polymerase III subunit beta [Corynebacterium flavescens]KAA8719583.1 DNA polymerase III subunit beta [Corynebacterium flavescens]MDN6099941.1 DNA polymerase III subunit beta [Corynebacterium flavescens]MDN6200262.1 DNA polymerase III subunit beta [Corynebacterium flavescens]MDN6226867.1 DNA polymerase III subunit beta [Corynebacterium flavescens]
MEQSVSFRVAKDDLADAVSWVARSLPSKVAQPVLRAMLITADDKGLEFSGFDYEVSTRVRIAAMVDEPGRIAVAGKLLADIVATLPNKEVEMTLEDNSQVVLSCGSSRFSLPIIPLDDYPQLPQLPAVTGTIQPQLFVEAISQVASAAGRDDTLPMLTGVHMDIRGSHVEMTATDRFRLAMRTLEWDPSSPDVQAKLLVPAKTLQETGRSLDTHLNTPVEIAVGEGENIGAEGLFGVHAANREITTRMLDADFPNVAPLLPKTHTAIASIEVAPLQEAIRRVSLLTDRNAQIRMEFSEGQVILAAGAESGNATETLPCAFTGRDEFLIAFNPGYLKDGLSVVHTNRVVFGFTEPSRPAIMIPEPEVLPEVNEDGVFPTPQTDFTYLLMPVRLPG